VSNHPIIRRLIKDRPPPTTSRHSSQRPGPQRRAGILNNLDLAVLRPENQNPTHVTSSIASMAAGLFRERLVVIGAPPILPDDSLLKKQEKIRQLWLQRLFLKGQKRAVVINPGRSHNRVKKGSRFLNSIVIDDEPYEVRSTLDSG
jgi:DNA (cytosine-5)-methyltransferase 1